VRSVLVMVAAACGSTASPNQGAPAVQADEVATPTEQAASAPVMPQQAAVIPVTFPATCKSIAGDIEKLTRQFPQLTSYRAVDQHDCTIRYQHKTHKPTTRGGWSAGVPQPDADGIWFYIGVYDPNGPEAQSQIHTQPVVPNWWIGSRKVMFLILEGDKTTPAAGAIMKVLERHGLVTR
jgi:hypothetical protein